MIHHLVAICTIRCKRCTAAANIFVVTTGNPSAIPVERDVWLTIPNALTLLRLLAIIPFCVFAMEGNDGIAIALFILAGLTDTLDGTIARRLQQASKIGRLLDPLVDKLFTGAAFVVLSVFRSGFRSIPVWVMGVVLLRDLLILAGSLFVYSAKRNSQFKPSIYGKLNTLLEIVVVVWFLSVSVLPGVEAAILPLYVLLIITILGSTIDYLRVGLRMMNDPAAGAGS